MVHRDRIWMWIWRAAFASLVAGVFGGFCVFWDRTFNADDLPALATAVEAPRTSDCNCALPTPAKIDEAVPSLDLDDTLVEAEDEEAPGIDQVLEQKRARAESMMFQARILGPYALSVRDGLNEIVIGTHLHAEGIADAALDDKVLSSVPSQLPTHGYISSGFGERRSPFSGRRVHHNGVDFAVPRGSPVYATADGEVVSAGWSRGLGKMVMIDHGYGIVTRYGHNSALIVKAGDHVSRGQQIAKAGSTGRSTGSHVHYEVWINDHAIDPARFMFELPDRFQEGVAMAYSPRGEERHLGLAMGGDGAPVTRLGGLRPVSSGPKAEERVAGNIGILGIFILAALALVHFVAPRRAIALRRPEAKRGGSRKTTALPKSST